HVHDRKVSALPLTFILGSRSPRRRELLAQIVPHEQIEILPPRDSNEAGFDGLTEWDDIQRRLQEIARTKCAGVRQQLVEDGREQYTPLIAADTASVATDHSGKLAVLGQPPEDDSWQDVVRRWFVEYYAGRTHAALSALCIATAFKEVSRGGRIVERIVKSE